MNRPPSDSQLVFQIAQRDVVAFQTLYARYAKTMLTAASKVLPLPEAKDLVQEIFVKLWETPEKFQRADDFKAFLYKTTSNRALDALRKTVSAKLAYERLTTELKKTENTTQDQLDKADLQRRLDNAISLMPPRQAEVYRLAIQNELGYKEIAKRLKKSPNTVKHQLAEAQQFVREHLGHYYRFGVIVAWLFVG